MLWQTVKAKKKIYIYIEVQHTCKAKDITSPLQIIVGGLHEEDSTCMVNLAILPAVISLSTACMVSWQEYHSGIEHKTPETETQLIFLLHGYVCGFNEL